MDSLVGAVPLLAGGACLIALERGLRYHGFDRRSRAAACICILTWSIIRRPLILPFRTEDLWLWLAGCLLSVGPSALLGNQWYRPPRLWAVLDLSARAALLAAFLNSFSWALLARDQSGPGWAGVVCLFAYAAIGGFVIHESGQCRLLQRPAGLVAGEILLTAGLMFAFYSAVASRLLPGVIAIATAMAGAVLVIIRVSAFLHQKEVHRLLAGHKEREGVLQPEYTGPSVECPEPQRWSMHDSMTAEVEVLDLLRSIVKALKPALVVETGTFTGISSLWIAEGLRDNGRGQLITCESAQAVYDAALDRISASPLMAYIDLRRCSSLELDIDRPIDLLFCDSDLGVREAEVRHFLPMINPHGLILMHYAGSRFPVVREAAFRLESEGLISVVAISTPRGLVIAQKREGRR